MARERTRADKLFAAAVLRRSMELGGERDLQGFRTVYEGVLRDLGLDEADVADFLARHLAEVDGAIGRRGK